MNCDEKQKETAAHALGALEPAAASAIDAQAASDPALQSELTRFRDVTAAIAANCVPPETAVANSARSCPGSDPKHPATPTRSRDGPPKTTRGATGRVFIFACQ